jgi:hypothetical protein
MPQRSKDLRKLDVKGLNDMLCRGTRLLPVALLLLVLLAGCRTVATGGAPPPSTPIPAPTHTPVPTATQASTSVPAAAHTIPLTIGEHVLQVELATTPEERAQGLMFREDLPPDGGMLFVFPSSAPRSFWMQNTPLPLSIAFLDEEGRILNIAQMEPLDTGPRYRSAGPARYALEVHQGWFAERGIEAGDRCRFELPADTPIE